MKRVLLLSENFPPVTGGAARRFWEIYRRLPAREVTVVTGWAAEPPETSQPDWPEIVRFDRATSTREFSGNLPLWPFGSALGTVRETVRRRRVESIHCGRPIPEGWLALAVRLLDGVPYHCFVHGEDINVGGDAELGGLMTSRRYRRMTQLVLARAERVIACSEFAAALVREHWKVDPRRIAISLPGVDTSVFEPAEVNDAPPFPEWHGRRVVLTAGRLDERKGHDVLIRAIAAIRAIAPDVLLVVAGGGEREATLRALGTRLGIDGHLRFLGQVSEGLLRACYRHCDLFVLANRQVGYDVEGFGMVLLEAQACGKPVIAGSSGGAPETLKDGVTGVVVDCDRPEPLAEAIVALLNDEERRRAMGREARRLMVERFDWESLRHRHWLDDDVPPGNAS